MSNPSAVIDLLRRLIQFDKRFPGTVGLLANLIPELPEFLTKSARITRQMLAADGLVKYVRSRQIDQRRCTHHAAYAIFTNYSTGFGFISGG